ncbi:MAG: phosphotransferase [Opitutaceae bacterium]|nr:phosphotransferase [Opitutaceae bacterium]
MLPNDELARLIEPYGLDGDGLVFVRYSQNLVYRHAGERGDVIVRLSMGRHRTLAEVEAELAWIRDLRAHGVPACAPRPTRDGRMCVGAETAGEPVVVACFEHAPGRPINPSDLDDAMYARLGALVARMHGVARAGPRYARPAWFESRLLVDDLSAQGSRLPVAFREGVGRLVAGLRALPPSNQGWGLIHADVSFGNCFIEGDQLWIFDFDNAEYGHFAQDLATVLYDSIYCRVLNKFADPGLTARMAPRWAAFLRGYAQAGGTCPIDGALLKAFFLLREAIIYVHYHRVLDLKAASDELRAGLDVMRRNVENGTHQVDFDALSVGG